MRNLFKVLVRVVTRQIYRVFLALFMANFLLVADAFSQSADEQDWWFNVEFIAFKRTLLPTNNENFEKADFEMSASVPVDLFSLGLIKQQAPLQFYLDQLPLCSITEGSNVNSRSVNSLQENENTGLENTNIDIETTDVVITDEAFRSAVKIIQQQSNVMAIELPESHQGDNIRPINPKLPDENIINAGQEVVSTDTGNSDADLLIAEVSNTEGNIIATTGLDAPNEETPVIVNLPALFAFEHNDATHNKLLCIEQSANVENNVDFDFQELTHSFPPLHQTITEIPSRMFAREASFNFTHHLISPEELTLEDYVQKVLRQRDIQPLLYTAWRQQVVFGEENADFYRIKAGKLLVIEDEFNYEEALTRFNSTKEIEIEEQSLTNNEVFFAELSEALRKQEPIDWLSEQSATASNEQQKQVQQARWELEGLIKVYLDYVNQVPYLHVNNEFKHYKIRVKEGGESSLEAYPLKQRRRIISKQIHYFDHPAFGIIIRLERFVPPVVEETDIETE